MRSSERPATQTWRPVSLRDLAQRLQPRGVGREGGDEHAALAPCRPPRSRPSRTLASEPDALGVEDVGRIADQREHALVADRASVRRRSVGVAEHRRRRRASSRRCGRCGRRACRSAARCPRGSSAASGTKREAERPELETAAALDDVELDPVGDALLLELAADQPGGERRRVERHAEIVGEIGQRADMVLMAVGQDDAEQVVAPLLDELRGRAGSASTPG